VKKTAAEGPPPGGGLKTVTCAIPALAMSWAVIETESSVLVGLNLVGRGELFQKATEADIKPVPEMLMVKAGPPAVALVGKMAVILGVSWKGGLLLPPQPRSNAAAPAANASAADREHSNPIQPPRNSMGIPRPLATSSREAKRGKRHTACQSPSKTDKIDSIPSRSPSTRIRKRRVGLAGDRDAAAAASLCDTPCGSIGIEDARKSQGGHDGNGACFAMSVECSEASDKVALLRDRKLGFKFH
jgi:hypothetical protein